MARRPGPEQIAVTSGRPTIGPALASPAAFGADVGQALQVVGGEVQKEAQRRADAEQRLADAAAISDAQDGLLRAGKDLQDLEADLQAGDWRTALKAFDEKSTAIKAANRQRLASPEAKARYDQRISTSLLSARGRIGQFQRDRQIEHGKATLDLTLDEAARALGNVATDREAFNFHMDLARQAVAESVTAGYITAEEGAERLIETRHEATRGAIFNWMEQQSSLSKASRALERNDFDSDHLIDLWGDLPPEERFKLRREALQAMNARQTLKRRDAEDRDQAIEDRNEEEIRQFYATDNFGERARILGRIEELGIVKGERLKALRDFHEAAPVVARDDPAVVTDLRIGIMTGEMDLGDISDSAGSLTPDTTDAMIGLFFAQREKRANRAVRFIRSEFGVLEDTVISSRASEAAAREAGAAIASLIDTLDKNPTADPMEIARILVQTGGETVRREEETTLRTRMQLIGGQIEGFDVDDPEASLEKALTEGLVEADAREYLATRAIIDQMKRKGYALVEPTR